MDKFLAEYRKLNPEHYDEKVAKELYKSLEKEERKMTPDDVTFIQVPGVAKLSKRDPKEPKVKPEKTPEELAEIQRNLEKTEEMKRRGVERTQLHDIINNWELGLKRMVSNDPVPQYPLHPQTRRLVSPYDIVRIIERAMIFNHETEMDDTTESIHLPFLLITLISDASIVQELHASFANTPYIASKSLYSFFITRGIQVNTEDGTSFKEMILPPLREEYIKYIREQFQKKYPKTLELNELTTEIITQKSPLDNIHNSVDLLELIKKNPTVLSKISDDELTFFKLTPSQIIQLRIAAATKDNTRKRNKEISAVLVPAPIIPQEEHFILTDITETKKDGDSLQTKKSHKTALRIFAAISP
jgi:hypothetical protein